MDFGWKSDILFKSVTEKLSKSHDHVVRVIATKIF